MSAVAAPYGFKPQGNVISAAYNQKTRTFLIASGYATSIFYGDPVIGITTGFINKETGTTAVTSPGILGIFLGCSYTDPNTLQKVFKQFWPASTVASDATAYVFDDPEGVFQIQGDGAFTQATLFANAALIQNAGSTVTGNSKITVQLSSVNVTTTLPVKIVGFANSPTSAVGDAFTDLFVKINFGSHSYQNATAI